jgi:N-acetylmuramoyl-L-alanine amidase
MANAIYEEVNKRPRCRAFLLKTTVSPLGTDSYAFDQKGATDLRKRPSLCEERGCTGFYLSVHHNAADNPKARGTSIMYFDPEVRLKENPPAEERKFIEDNLAQLKQKRDTSRKCAQELVKRVVDAYRSFDGEWKDRGAKARAVTVIERGPPDMPAVLVELGFLTSAEDRKHLIDEQVRLEVARAIAEGICTCCGEAANSE